MTVRDLVVTPVAEQLRDCLRAALAEVPDPPGDVCLRVGTETDLLVSTFRDECCEGLGWVRLASAHAASTFPDQDQAPSRCNPGRWAVTLEMGVARCAPTTDAATIPSCDDWTAAALAVYDDLAAMWRALDCFAAAPLNRDRLWLAGQWVPIPTEGGCMGAILPVTVAVDIC